MLLKISVMVLVILLASCTSTKEINELEAEVAKKTLVRYINSIVQEDLYTANFYLSEDSKYKNISEDDLKMLSSLNAYEKAINKRTKYSIVKFRFEKNRFNAVVEFSFPERMKLIPIMFVSAYFATATLEGEEGLDAMIEKFIKEKNIGMVSNVKKYAVIKEGGSWKVENK